MRREKTETSGAAKVASMLQSVPHKMEEEEKEKEEGSGNCSLPMRVLFQMFLHLTMKQRSCLVQLA